jgi:hypothetical protein
VQAVASKMGKSIKWVRQRQALGTKLSKDWRTAIAEDDYQNQIRHWTASHLQLVARLPKPTQAEMLEYYHYEEEIPTVKQLDDHITDLLQLLSKASFDIAEAGCAKCQKRTSCQPGLFDDTLDTEALKKNDRCLDGSCWNKKTQAWLIAKFDAKKNELPNLVAISTDDTTYQQNVILKEVWPDFFQKYNIQQARKKDKGAIPGLIIHGKALGTVLWIKPTGSRAQEKTGRTAGKPTPLKERRLMLDCKRWAQVLRELCEIIKDAKAESVHEYDLSAVETLAGLVGTIKNHEYLYQDEDDWKKFNKIMGDITGKPIGDTEKQITERLWEQVRPVLISRITYNGPITQTPPEYIDEARAVSKLLGINVEAMFEKVAEQDYPEPKNWKGLNADGTPKTAKAKKARKKIKVKKVKSKKTVKKNEETREKVR